jgi:putrescine transport system permease protein
VGAFVRVIVPYLMPAILSGALMSFTLSLDELIVTYFVSGPGSTTLPLVVFSRVRLGLNPEMNALATLFIAVVTVGVVAVNYFMQRAERRRVQVRG